MRNSWLALLLEKASETVLEDPVGGLDCCGLNERVWSFPSVCLRPVEDTVKQATPERWPELETQTRFGLAGEVSIGLPMRASSVGSLGLIANVDSVFELALAANR